MKKNLSINLLNLLLSLSDAMDLAGPELVQHQLRTAFIAWEMGKSAGLSDEDMAQMFYAALLHDIGAFSVEEKYELLKTETDMTEEHCLRGEMILNKIPWLENAAILVRHHHRKWEDCRTNIDDPMTLGSHIIFLADFLERSINRKTYILHQSRELTSRIVEKTGSVFHPDVTDLLLSAGIREEFWLDMVSNRLYSYLLHHGPHREFEIDSVSLLTISEIFSDIIDFRSRFTSTHSSGVAASAVFLSKLFGLTEPELLLMEIAGRLNDLGKLAIPNSILEKPGKLTPEEFAVIKSHTYYTYSIMNSIGGFQQIQEWAAFHHERLDGSGYPFHCNAGELSIESRIMMVADMFTAMEEDRPYRKGMDKQEIIRIFSAFSNRGLLEKRIVDLVIENWDDMSAYMKQRQEAARTFYEKQFLLPEKAKV